MVKVKYVIISFSEFIVRGQVRTLQMFTGSYSETQGKSIVFIELFVIFTGNKEFSTKAKLF